MAQATPNAVIHTGTIAQTTITIGRSVLYTLHIPTALIAAATVVGFNNPAGDATTLTLPIGTQGIVDLSAGRGVIVPRDLKITLGNTADAIQIIYEV